MYTRKTTYLVQSIPYQLHPRKHVILLLSCAIAGNSAGRGLLATDWLRNLSDLCCIPCILLLTLEKYSGSCFLYWPNLLVFLVRASG